MPITLRKEISIKIIDSVIGNISKEQEKPKHYATEVKITTNSKTTKVLRNG